MFKKLAKPETNLEHQNFYLKKQISGLEKELKHFKTEDGRLSEFFADLKTAVVTTKPKKIYIQNNRNVKVSSNISAVLCLSDWHIGEVTDSKKIENVCSYNYNIATRRVEKLVQNFIDWCKLQKSMYQIKEVVIPVLGDLLSGNIHYELEVSNEFPITTQIVKASELLSIAISEISRFFPCRCEFISWDNHSRLTKKMQFKQGPENSYGALVGTLVQEKLKNLSNINFNLYLQDKKLVNIQGFNYLCEHGGEIKSWLGIPFYGIERMVGSEAKTRLGQVDRQFKKMLIGHWHQPIRSQYFIVNGALSGSNELDHAVGRFCKPCQISFLCHPKFADFNFCEFFLD